MRDYDDDIPNVADMHFEGRNDKEKRAAKRFWKRHYRKKQRRRDREAILLDWEPVSKTGRAE